MNILCMVHVPFEDAANIETWARLRGHALRYVKLYKGDVLPEMDSFDFLAVMGGTMNIYEHDDHPWLIDEKRFIRKAIEAGKKVLGVCLGGQLIADVLGGPVTRNRYPEIGWHTVTLTSHAKHLPPFADIAGDLIVFQWHGDTFSIPPGGIQLAYSAVCENQAFLYGSNVLGLQFHLEYTETSILEMLTNCSSELIDSPYVNNADSIRQNLDLVAEIQKKLYALLDWFSYNEHIVACQRT